jgi:hypothetical protein
MSHQRRQHADGAAAARGERRRAQEAGRDGPHGPLCSGDEALNEFDAVTVNPSDELRGCRYEPLKLTAYLKLPDGLAVIISKKARER